MIPPRIAATLRAFRHARSGIAAVEFALILPMMLTLYVGMTELSRALANSRKVVLLSRTVADLAARGTVLSQSNMDDIFSAGGAVMAPFDPSKARIVVSAIGIYQVGSTFKAYVCSSSAKNTTPRSVGVPDASTAFPTVPDAFKQDKMRYVLTEVAMDYTPIIGQTFVTFFAQPNGTVTFTEQTPWPVRAGATYNSPQPEIVLPKNNQACPTSIT